MVISRWLMALMSFADCKDEEQSTTNHEQRHRTHLSAINHNAHDLLFTILPSSFAILHLTIHQLTSTRPRALDHPIIMNTSLHSPRRSRFAAFTRFAICAGGLSVCLCPPPAAHADQTLTGVTTVDGTLKINPTDGRDGVSIKSGTADVALDQSWLTRGGIGFDIGRAASDGSWQDFAAHLQVNNTGSAPGLGFYLDQTLTNASAAITSVSPLYYTWNRGVVNSGGTTSDDITQRGTPIMRLGGTSNVLRLIHPTDATKGIELNPDGGTIMVNGRMVLTQSDSLGVDGGVNTSGLGYGSAAFGAGNNAAGWLTLVSGQGNTALGAASAALGAWSYAGGYASMALGCWAAAVGDSSVSLAGPNTYAYGASSFAAGSWSSAIPERSMVLGRGLVAHQAGQIVVGSYNDFASPAVAGRVFQLVVGNGVENPSDMYTEGDTSNRRNALEIETSGRATIRHKDHASDANAEALNVLGTATVSRKLTVSGAAVLNGGTSITGDAKVTGTLTATQKVRVPAGGDLPMADDFQNDGGLGAP